MEKPIPWHGGWPSPPKGGWMSFFTARIAPEEPRCLLCLLINAQIFGNSIPVQTWKISDSLTLTLCGNAVGYFNKTGSKTCLHH